MPSRNVTLMVRAVGARTAARDVTGLSRATRGLGTSAGSAGRSMQGLDNAMAAVGRTTTTIGLGLGVVGALAVKTGFQYNAMMEQQTIAFSNMMGSTQKAEAYLKRLYDLAAVTPFEFPQLVKGTRTMVSYGMATNEAYNTMKLLGDAVAANPTEDMANQIARTSRALGQVTAAGVLHAQDLNQLVDAGVTSVPKLAKNMGISTKQFRKQMALGKMDAERFFKAQRELWETDPIYSGAAAKQAKTFYGQLATLHDEAVRTMGNVTEGAFESITKRALPEFTAMTRAIGFIWNQDTLSFEEKLDLSWASVERHVRPLLNQFTAWWRSEEVGMRISNAFTKAMAGIAPVAADIGVDAAKAVYRAFWATSVAGKLTMLAVLMRFGLGRQILISAGVAAWGLLMRGFRKGKGGSGAAAGMGSVMNVTAGVVNVMGPGSGVAPVPGGSPGKPKKPPGKTSLLKTLAKGPLKALPAIGWTVAGADAASQIFAGRSIFDRSPNENRLGSVTGGRTGADRVNKGGLNRLMHGPRRPTEAQGWGGGMATAARDFVVHTSVNVDGKEVAKAVHRAAKRKAATR